MLRMKFDSILKALVLFSVAQLFSPYSSYRGSSMPRLAREQATEFQAVEGENDFIRHKVSSFRSLFDFFSIVQNHYSLRNTAVDEKGESGGSSSDSSPVQKFAAVVLDGSNVEPPIQEAALSWNRLYLS